MAKDPRITREVDHPINIIKECDKGKHARMRRTLSHAFSMTKFLKNEDVLKRRIDEFLDVLGTLDSTDETRRIAIVQQFNYVTFNRIGEMSFGES